MFGRCQTFFCCVYIMPKCFLKYRCNLTFLCKAYCVADEARLICNQKYHTRVNGMTEEEKSIQKNKKILMTFVLAVVAVLFSCVLIASSPGEGPDLQYLWNRFVSDPVSFIGAMVGLLFFWFFIFGALASSSIFLLMLCLYSFLHRKDPRFFERHYYPKYEEEFYYGGKVAFVSSYTATLILLILYATNIITFNFG